MRTSVIHKRAKILSNVCHISDMNWQEIVRTSVDMSQSFVGKISVIVNLAESLSYLKPIDFALKWYLMLICQKVIIVHVQGLKPVVTKPLNKIG